MEHGICVCACFLSHTHPEVYAVYLWFWDHQPFLACVVYNRWYSGLVSLVSLFSFQWLAIMTIFTHYIHAHVIFGNVCIAFVYSLRVNLIVVPKGVTVYSSALTLGLLVPPLRCVRIPEYLTVLVVFSALAF